MRTTEKQNITARAVQKEDESIGYDEALRLARYASRILSSAFRFLDEKTGKWVLRELAKMHGRIRKGRGSVKGEALEITLEEIRLFETIVNNNLRTLLRTASGKC
jgi:hypothetical protein